MISGCFDDGHLVLLFVVLYASLVIETQADKMYHQISALFSSKATAEDRSPTM